MRDAGSQDDVLLEVRCFSADTLELMTAEQAALRSGIRLDELLDALVAFGACETDGYVIKPHDTIYASRLCSGCWKEEA